MHISKKDLFTIPNIMTYFRILLVPVFCVVYVNAKGLAGHIWAIVIVLAAAATDVFDGYVARKTGQITDLGKILDPIADKGMQFAMIFCVIIKYKLVIILLIIYGAKELISLALTSYLLANGKHIEGARWYGKLCTVVLYIVMLAFIVLPEVKNPWYMILICISGAFMLLAFVLYMTAYIKLFIELRKEQKQELPH